MGGCGTGEERSHILAWEIPLWWQHGLRDSGGSRWDWVFPLLVCQCCHAVIPSSALPHGDSTGSFGSHCPS